MTNVMRHIQKFPGNKVDPMFYPHISHFYPAEGFFKILDHFAGLMPGKCKGYSGFTDSIALPVVQSLAISSDAKLETGRSPEVLPSG